MLFSYDLLFHKIVAWKVVFLFYSFLIANIFTGNFFLELFLNKLWMESFLHPQSRWGRAQSLLETGGHNFVFKKSGKWPSVNDVTQFWTIFSPSHACYKFGLFGVFIKHLISSPYDRDVIHRLPQAQICHSHCFNILFL